MPIVCVEYKTFRNDPSHKINNHNKIEIVLIAVKQLKRVEIYELYMLTFRQFTYFMYKGYG